MFTDIFLAISPQKQNTFSNTISQAIIAQVIVKFSWQVKKSNCMNKMNDSFKVSESCSSFSFQRTCTVIMRFVQFRLLNDLTKATRIGLQKTKWQSCGFLSKALPSSHSLKDALTKLGSRGLVDSQIKHNSMNYWNRAHFFLICKTL